MVIAPDALTPSLGSRLARIAAGEVQPSELWTEVVSGRKLPRHDHDFN